ncbi:hypothetical protein [Cupriavidus pauculus]|uniref:hypothetical protein n=1 Tax=Cupriavidus pauculus TaxID=82633 RepID=UPI001EE2F8F2|nr:hypothetical protein [Cupriavidus pauculus]GJG98189.1 hypothetical protein CBA19C6_26890 [Cupriavidus pauculus]
MKPVAILAAVMFAVSAPVAIGQTTTSATTSAKSQPPTDEIVHMRQEISAARKAYNTKVSEAKKVYDEAKAAAAKERDAAISAARANANQKKS